MVMMTVLMLIALIVIIANIISKKGTFYAASVVAYLSQQRSMR